MLSTEQITDIIHALSEEETRFTGKTITITGGLGFLGLAFIQVFRQLNKEHITEPCTVSVVDNLIAPSATSMEQDENIRFYERDITDPDELEIPPCDYLINGAGIASPFYYQKFPLETLEVCYTGTKRMLSLALRDNAKMIQFSSSEIYGNPHPDYVPTPETYYGRVSSIGPRSCYDEGKRVGEALCMSYFHTRQVNVSIIRPFNVYGEGMHEKDYRVVPTFAYALKNNKPLLIHGHGTQTRTYCYITDAIAGFLKVLLLGKAGEVYNIGNPEPEITVTDLAMKMVRISRLRDVNLEMINYPDTYPADEPMRRCPDISKARIELGYNPRITLDEGLKRYISSIGVQAYDVT